jgi:sulfur relay protein TusB/DsrH
MLFLISSAPDTREFKTAIRMANEMKADVCLLQNAVYAAQEAEYGTFHVLSDDLRLRGITPDKIKGKAINYEQLVDLMAEADKVAGIF